MVIHPVAFRLRHSQQPADHIPEPSSHTDRLFQHLSPWLLCKIQLKITNLEKQSMNEACGFVGAEPSLAPSWFWVPCSVAVTLQSWASLTKQSTFKPNFKFCHLKCCWTAAHTRSFLGTSPTGLQQMTPRPWLEVPWKQDCCLLLFWLQAYAPLHVRGEQTHLGPCAFRDRGIQKDLSAMRISNSSPEHPQLLHHKCYLSSSSSLACLVPKTHPAQFENRHDEIPQFQS